MQFRHTTSYFLVQNSALPSSIEPDNIAFGDRRSSSCRCSLQWNPLLQERYTWHPLTVDVWMRSNLVQDVTYLQPLSLLNVHHWWYPRPFSRHILFQVINDSCSKRRRSSTKVLTLVLACRLITRTSKLIVLLEMFSALAISLSERPWEYSPITLDLRTIILSG